MLLTVTTVLSGLLQVATVNVWFQVLVKMSRRYLGTAVD